MIDKLIQIDVDLFLYLNNLGVESWDPFWLFITSPIASIPVYLFVLILLYKYYGLKQTLLILVGIGIMIGLSDQTSNLFKYGFERLRPCHNPNLEGIMRQVKSSCGGYYSFFSAHASTSMAIALVSALFVRKQAYWTARLLIVWALLVGYSRIYLGVHYPFDVLFGIEVGVVYATIIYNVLMIIIVKSKYFEYKMFNDRDI